MLSGFGPAEVAAIDALTHRVCALRRPDGELKQLRRLFGRAFLDELQTILQAGLPSTGSAPPHLEVSLSWIDKIPVAEFSGSTKKVEFGDALLVAIDKQLHATGVTTTLDGRAVFLQAKLARTVARLTAPTVPVTPLKEGSTQKELDFLSAWPRFDLFETATNTSAVLTGVSVPPGRPERYGWYIAAPGDPIPLAASTAWPAWWMCGPPHGGAVCNLSFGGLLVGFLSGVGSGSHAIGERFVSRRAATALSPDWSDLCNAVRKIVGGRDAPQSLFGQKQPRRETISLEAAAYRKSALGVSVFPGFAFWNEVHNRCAEWTRLSACHLRPVSFLNWLALWFGTGKDRLRIAVSDDGDPPCGELVMGPRKRPGRFAVLTVTMTRPPEDRPD